MSASPAVGEPAPDFVLRDQHGADVRLSALQGRPVVVMFFPFAFSRVCTGELRGVRDHPALGNPDVAVLALSCDPMFTLRAFAEAEGFGFPLLSDFWPHGDVAVSYGVFDGKSGYARRSTFVLDAAGVVRWTAHHALPDARDAGELAGVLDRLTGPGR